MSTASDNRWLPFGDEDLIFLVNRTTQGFSLPMYERAKSLGYQGFLEWQLDHERIDDSDLDAILRGLPSLPMRNAELYSHYVLPHREDIPYLELKSASVYRAVYSRRQLLERMVEFWSDHFNVDQRELGCLTLKTVDDRDVIRANALGKFPDLLKASAHSGCMLYYLDCYTNTARAPQENYAREIMELHTLGVDGGYSEQDVRELARCLTGWSFYYGRPWIDYGKFRFQREQHDQGWKRVLGVDLPPLGGVHDGETMLEVLANHPSTARFIARKLCRFLLSYEPSDAVVQDVARTYLATGGDIKAMIRLILHPARLRESEPTSLLKLRRPFHLMASLLRATLATVSDATGLLDELRLMGHYPFGYRAPTGYPDTLAAWSGSLVPRWTFASRLFANQIPGVNLEPARIVQLIGDMPPSGYGEAINRLLTGGTMAPAEVQAIQDYMNSADYFDWPIVAEALALAAAAPSYQYY